MASSSVTSVTSVTGSGVFFNLGKTVVVSSHGELWYKLGCTREFVDRHRDEAIYWLDETLAPTWLMEYHCARHKRYAAQLCMRARCSH